MRGIGRVGQPSVDRKDHQVLGQDLCTLPLRRVCTHQLRRESDSQKLRNYRVSPTTVIFVSVRNFL
jgi:hypothetical protein